MHHRPGKDLARDSLDQSCDPGGGIFAAATPGNKTDRTKAARPLQRDDRHVLVIRRNFGSDVQRGQEGNTHSHSGHQADRIQTGPFVIGAQLGPKRFAKVSNPLAQGKGWAKGQNRLAGATEAEVAAQLQVIERRIACLEDADLVEALWADRRLFELFRDMGPDLTITTYALNLVTGSGVNDDLALMNEMNALIYRKLSLQVFNGGEVPKTPMFITQSAFDPAGYGQEFVDAFARRAGVTPAPGMPLSFLISTTQNPWLKRGGRHGHVAHFDEGSGADGKCRRTGFSRRRAKAACGSDRDLCQKQRPAAGRMDQRCSTTPATKRTIRRAVAAMIAPMGATTRGIRRWTMSRCAAPELRICRISTR